MNGAGVRAEIKSWERSFKADNCRDPSVCDIKANPEIAAKYKLYKKLSKDASTSFSKIEKYIVPSTPPRRSSALPASSFLVPKSRAIETFADPATVNPFSPTKISRKRASDPAFLDQPRFMNPPTTPPSKKRAYSTPSPDVIRSSSSQIAARYDTSSAGNSVVKNARKRLRGDALSPSPNRFDKKWRSTSVRRSTGLQSALPAYNTDTPKNDLEPDISYVDESPVKSISNGKDFKLLFEEERLPKLDFSKKNGAVSQSRSFFVPLDGRIKGGSPEIILDGKGGAAKMVEIRGQDKVITTSNKAENMKASLRPNFTYGKQSCNSVSTLTQDSILVTREEDGKGAGFSSTNRKRSSSEDASGLRNEEQSFVDLTDKLIPPSPPSTAVGAHEERSKGTNKTRKRVKLLADKTIEDYSTDDENDIRIIDFDQQSRRNNGDSRVSVSDEGDDTETRIGLSRIAEDVVYDGDELEINLPDDLRKVLYISSSRARDREERTIVESLLRGGPEYRNERGEIWGIGEVEDATSTITDGEDDWAGEGVPWEAGEL